MKLIKSLKKNKYFLIVLLIFFIFFSINLHWILNHSPDYDSEDMLLLEKSIHILKNWNHGLEKTFLFFLTNFVILIFTLGIKLFRNVYVPLIINSLFGLVLVSSTYGISSKIYGKKAGILAVFLLLTTPIVIGLSRVIYIEFALSSLFVLCIYFFIRSNLFLDFKFTLFFAVLFIICLYSKHSMIAYLGSFYLFIIIRFILLKKEDEGSSSNSKRFRNFFVFGVLITYSLLFFYFYSESIAQNIWNNNFLFQFNTYKPLHNLFCNALTYPCQTLNYTLGFFLFLTFIFALIVFFYRIFKSKVNEEEVLLFFLIGINYIFFSFFVLVKNWQVPFMIIPLIIIIIISGFVFYIPKKFRFFIIIILILNGLIYLLPMNVYIGINPLTRLSQKINCSVPYSGNYISQTYELFNKNYHISKKVFDYENIRKQYQNLTSTILNDSTSKKVYVLDLSNFNHNQISFYAFIFNHLVEFTYDKCEDIDFGSEIKEYDYIITSDNSYAYSIRTKLSFQLYDDINKCEELRQKIHLNYPIISEYICSQHQEKLYLYKMN